MKKKKKKKKNCIRLEKIRTKCEAGVPFFGSVYMNWEKINTQGQVTPKLKVGSGKNSNLSEVLCLFYLSASLMKSQQK